MEARSLGPARSPGRAIYEQELERSNRQQSNPVVSSESTLLSSIRSIFPSYNSSKTAVLEFKSRVTALPRPYHTNFAAIDTFETQIDEELAWFGSKLVWSRGSTVYRTFTYYQEKQKVTNAIFARFTLEAEPKWRSGPGPQNGKAENDELSSEPAIAEVNTDKQSEGPQTFGPFHTSQHAKWGRPDKRNGSGHSAKGKQQAQQRCLVVLLEDWIHVYYPSGHDLVVALPFPIDDVWAIPSGGIMLQRAMNNREVERLRSAKSRELGPVKIAGGMDLDATMELVLEELEMDRMEGVLGGNGTEDARLYTLTHPSSELQTVCQSCHIPGGHRDIECRDNSVVRLDQVEPLEPEKELIWLSDTKDTKLAVFHNHKTDEIVFARWENCNDESVADAPETDHNIKAVGGSAIKAHDVSTKRPDAPLRPGLGRVDSTSGSLLEKRSSLGGSRSLGRAHNRRVSFKPDVLNPAVEKANHDPLAALEGETAISTRIKAEGDLVRGLPHQRRVSQGMKEVERKNKVTFDDLDVGENTMLFGIDQPKDRMQPDMVMMEIHRWPLPDSTLLSGKIQAFASDQLGADSIHINIHVRSNAEPLLYIFRLERVQNDTPTWRATEIVGLPADAAVPIICTRARIFDVLVLDKGRAKIVTSHGRFVEVNLPGTATSAPPATGKVPWKEATAIQDLLNPISSRVTLKGYDGTETLLDLNYSSSSSDVNQVIHAISQVLPEEATMNIKLNILTQLRSARVDSQEVLRSVGHVILASLGFEIKPTLRADSPWTRLKARAGRDSRLDIRSRHVDSGPETAGFGNRCMLPGQISVEFTPNVLQALHVLAQEYLLRMSHHDRLMHLVPIILTLATYLKLSTWVDHWRRHLPSAGLIDMKYPTPFPGIIPPHLLVPTDILDLLRRTMMTRRLTIPKQLVLRSSASAGASRELGHSETLPHLTLVLHLYRMLGTANMDADLADKALRFMVSHGVTMDWMNNLPWSIALPVWEAIRVGRTVPSMDWPVQVYSLVDRLDIAAQLDLGHRSVLTVPSTSDRAPVGQDVSSYKTILSQVTPLSSTTTGLDMLNAKHKGRRLPVPNVRFPNDRRLWDVESLLQTTQSRPVKPEDKPHLTEEQRLVQHQTLVHSLGYRTISQTVGYGLFILDSKEPSNTDRFEIPNINVGVQLLPSTTTIFPEFKVENLSWPAFHQGVAAGLSIKRNSNVVNSSWIFYNKPDQPTPAFGGFLLGLGLTGHLRNLETWHLYPNLAQRHDHVSVGLLLGMAATYAGSQDRRLTTMLSAGVSALLPPGSVSLNTSPILQSASLFGLGLVHLASGSHRLAETSLSEIGRYELPGLDDQGENKELYAFSAACAFGLIMLGQGGRNREHDVHCVNRLRGYFVDLHQPENEAQDPSLGTHRDVNTTAGGSVLALGLMYLRTNQSGVAHLLLPPQNAFELDHIRPDMLIVRTLSYNLILWDEIEPSRSWLNAQYPSFVLAAWKLKAATGFIDEVQELAYFHITAGACFVLGLKYAGTMNKYASQIILDAYELFLQQMLPSTTSYETKIKRIALRQGFALLLIAQALVAAGTGDILTYRRLRSLHGGDGHPYSTRTALHTAIGILHVGAGRYSFGRSNLAIAAMVIALFPRYPTAMDDNRSYLQAWRHLWAIAIEPRCIATVDIDTLKPVVLPMTIRLRNADGKLEQRDRETTSPYLADAFERTVTLAGTSPRYASPVIHVETSALQREVLLRLQTMFVKRKSNNLDYSEDPKGNRSISILANAAQMAQGELLHSLTGPTYRAKELDTIESIVTEFSGDPIYRGFLSAFGSHDKTSPHPGKHFSWTYACETIVLDSLLQNQPELTALHFGLLSSLDALDSRYGAVNLGLLDIALEFCASVQTERLRSPTGSAKSIKIPPLIRRSILTAIFANERKVVRHRLGVDSDSEKQYLRAVGTGEECIVTPDLGAELVSNRVPSLEKLHDLRKNIEAVDRRATAASASLKDRNVVARSALLKMAYAETLAQPQYETTIPTPLETWTDRSLTNALREWCQ